MHNRYSDFEELRPTGEVSHIPDAKLVIGLVVRFVISTTPSVEDVYSCVSAMILDDFDRVCERTGGYFPMFDDILIPTDGSTELIVFVQRHAERVHDVSVSNDHVKKIMREI